MEPWADQYVLIWSGGVGGPGDLSRVLVEGLHPAANAELTSANADDDLVLHDQRSHCHALAFLDVADLRSPQLLSCVGVQSDGEIVERIDVELSVGEDTAAVDHVATCHSLRCGRGMRIETPFHRSAWPRQVERVHDVRKWRDDVHRVVSDNRCSFSAAVRSQGKRERYSKVL